MLGMCWSRQTLGKGVSNHEIGAKRHEFENLLCDQVTHKVAANINVTRVLRIAQVISLPPTSPSALPDSKRERRRERERWRERYSGKRTWAARGMRCMRVIRQKMH
jgi:hypothetical protein